MNKRTVSILFVLVQVITSKDPCSDVAPVWEDITYGTAALDIAASKITNDIWITTKNPHDGGFYYQVAKYNKTEPSWDIHDEAPIGAITFNGLAVDEVGQVVISNNTHIYRQQNTEWNQVNITGDGLGVAVAGYGRLYINEQSKN